MTTFAQAYAKVEQGAKLLREAHDDLRHLPESPKTLTQLLKATMAAEAVARELS